MWGGGGESVGWKGDGKGRVGGCGKWGGSGGD